MDRKDINKKNVGKKIKQIRLSNGWTLIKFSDEISKIIGDKKQIAEGVISRWESGISLPNPKRLKAIAKIADMTVDELLYGSIKERIANILYRLSQDNKEYKYIDIKAFTKNIFHALPTSEISNNELEKYIEKYLKDWFSIEPTEQNDSIAWIDDSLKYTLDFHTKIVQPILKKRILQLEKKNLNDKELERFKKILDIEMQFFENLNEYIDEDYS